MKIPPAPVTASDNRIFRPLAFSGGADHKTSHESDKLLGTSSFHLPLRMPGLPVSYDLVTSSCVEAGIIRATAIAQSARTRTGIPNSRGNAARGLIIPPPLAVLRSAACIAWTPPTTASVPSMSRSPCVMRSARRRRWRAVHVQRPSTSIQKPSDPGGRA